MNINEYLEKIEVIRVEKLISAAELMKEVGITYNTYRRLHERPETVSLKTLRKLKKFVDGWKS